MKIYPTSFVDKIYKKRFGKYLLQIIIFVLVLAPVVTILGFSYVQTRKDMTEDALERRQVIAYLAASSLKANFDNIYIIGTSLASRTQLRNLATQNNWTESIKMAESIPKDFQFVDRVFLTDTRGTIVADTKPNSEVIGQNFAYRDWYKGVTKNWQPYLSEVYKRVAEPKFNVISFAVPLKENETENIIGIVVLQIRVDTLLEWSKKIDFGDHGFIYYSDQHGHIGAHPNYSSQGKIPDFFAKPYIQKAIRGEAGMEITKNENTKEQSLVVFEPVPEFGWSVIIEQPTYLVFANRDESLKSNLIMYLVIILIDILFAILGVELFKLINEKKILQSLDEELKKFKLALDNTSDHVIITDLNGIVMYANKAAEKLTGYSKKEIIGSKPSLWGKQMPEQFYKDMWKTIKIHKKDYEAQIKNRRKSGEEYYAFIKISPVLDDHNNLLFFVGIERDITHETEIDKAKTEFVSVASHQLRTPLGIIKWYLEVLEKDRYFEKAPEIIKKYLNEVSESNNRVLSVVRDLLSVSRIDQNRVKDKPKPIDIVKEIKNIHEQMLLLAKKKQISLNLVLPKNKIPEINIDNTKFYEIIENLTENAIKYTRTNGSVDITVNKKDKTILIEIKDTGIGISEKDRKKLFTKFFRSEKAIELNPEGSGLGLYIVKSYVEAWGGTIIVESVENKGSTFKISLPINKEGGDRNEKDTNS